METKQSKSKQSTSKQKIKETLWWDSSFGKEKDLRDLLYAITQKLGQKSVYGQLHNSNKEEKSNNNKRLFKNQFDKTLKDKQKTIFTTATIATILTEIYEQKIPPDKIILDITQSKFQIKAPDKFDKIVCDAIDKFVWNTNHKFNEQLLSCVGKKYYSCVDRTCFAYWFIKTIKHITINYWKIINDSNHVLPKYENKEEEKEVAKIFDAISAYEKAFEQRVQQQLSATPKNNEQLLEQKNEQLGKLFEIYQTCSRCCDIADVADEKLAYIKWYTTKLMNLPYFKTGLSQIGRYDETIVFKLLTSASNILDNLNKKVPLSSDVERDRLISFITLSYVQPLYLQKIIPAKELKEVVKNKLSILKTNSACKAYPALWLFLNLGKTNELAGFGEEELSEVEEKIECLDYDESISNEENLLIFAEYGIYRHLVAYHNVSKISSLLLRIKTNRAMLLNNFDTINTWLYLLFKYSDLVEFKFLSSLTDIYYDNLNFSCPSKYRRPLWDFQLLKALFTWRYVAEKPEPFIRKT